MARPVERIEPMLGLLRQIWLSNPDMRLGQVIANAARDRSRSSLDGLPEALAGETPARVGNTRDVFNVEDDEVWEGLKLMAEGRWDEALGWTD